MSEERAQELRKVLQLLSEGRLTPEQAELLLDALEQRSSIRTVVERWADRIPVEEFRRWGNQVTQTVNQTLDELRRNLDPSGWPGLDALPLPMGLGHTVSVTHEVNLPEGVTTIEIHTVRGRIQMVGWDERFARIHIRGRVKHPRLAEARQTLERAIHVREDGSARSIWVDHDPDAGVSAASIDMYVPLGLVRLLAKTNNGSILGDRLRVSDELRLETDQGGIWLTRVDAVRLRMVAETGQLALHDSLSERSRDAYLQTQNGKIVVKGLPEGLPVVGSARTVLGKLQLEGSGWQSDGDATRAGGVHFTRGEVGDGQAALRLHCETRAGSIQISAD